MDHSIIEEPSSCETASYSEHSPSCYIVLEVYFTSILRDPSLMNAETSILRKRFKLLENCSIMCHKESNQFVLSPVGVKVKVSRTKRDTAKFMTDGYFIVAEVKLHKKENGKHVFSLHRSTGNDGGYNQLKKAFAQCQKNNHNSSVFYSVKTERTQSENQEIRDNDLIKFGKEVYQAKIYSHKKQIKSIRMTDLAPIERKTKFQVKNNTGECKICLMGEGQCEKDYVVSPCRCSGTCSLVHVECLKNWIACKIEVRKGEEKLHTYDMSRFQCEICKQKYPEALQIEESLVDISPEIGINDDALFLTKIYPIEDQKRICHMVSLAKGGSLAVGRHYYNELILQDMSISRNHAEINRGEDSKFYLYDKNARFGTFVNLKSPVHNLNEAILLTSKQTFRFRLLEEEPVKLQRSSRCEEEQVTQERIEY